MVAVGTDWLGQVGGLSLGAGLGAAEPGPSPGSLEQGPWAWKLEGGASGNCLPSPWLAPGGICQSTGGFWSSRGLTF